MKSRKNHRETTSLIIGISQRTIILHLYQEQAFNHDSRRVEGWRKKTWPPDSFFSLLLTWSALQPPADSAIAIGPAQRRPMNYLEPDPTLPVRTEALIFSREKNHPAGQFCRGRPIGKRHAKTGTPLVDTGADHREPVPRLLVRLPDRPIQWPDMTSNRSFFPSCCPIVEKDFSVAMFFNELGSHVSVKSVPSCIINKNPVYDNWQRYLMIKESMFSRPELVDRILFKIIVRWIR